MGTHVDRPRRRVAVFVCTVIVALILDQSTKAWAQSALADGRSVRLIPGLLALTLVRNPGASLGLGSSITWLISVLAAAACVVIAIFALRTSSMVWTVALSLAFSGAAGNLIDRVVHAQGLLNGKVVDFLDYGWSVGNVADVYLVVAGVGIALLIIAGVPLTNEQHDPVVADAGNNGADADISGADISRDGGSAGQ